MIRIKTLAGLGAIGIGLLGANTRAQRNDALPSIGFGTAEVSLGMTVGQVERVLAQSARHLEFLSEDTHTALVRINHVAEPKGDEGQVTFLNGKAVYVAFQFPNATTAEQLGQELAGAVDSMDPKTCLASNYSSHGTGGSLSQTRFECGSKSFDVMTTESIGDAQRYTNVEITMGAIPRSH